ncbi:DinB family protein [Paenibacillus sp. 5J-6]|uniref:DinB family protein n=1 Tax=Paenibacillus silvestris TaxID=2606219 RepID=A0A6L8V0L0_9BACL|nr:DinB family protein [Paenibacillus silvestris]MZQ83242.1 DinB family protein [Paenibacillus silvestris]
MKTTIFEDMGIIRAQTLLAMEGLTEELIDRIPPGCRNNIRWQLGHIYFVTEHLTLSQLKLAMNLPEGFVERFGSGKGPLDYPDSLPKPTLPELKILLTEQLDRIRKQYPMDRLNESVDAINTSTGLLMVTPEQSLRYNLYHEGLHAGILSTYKRVLTQ